MQDLRRAISSLWLSSAKVHLERYVVNAIIHRIHSENKAKRLTARCVLWDKRKLGQSWLWSQWLKTPWSGRSRCAPLTSFIHHGPSQTNKLRVVLVFNPFPDMARSDWARRACFSVYKSVADTTQVLFSGEDGPGDKCKGIRFKPANARYRLPTCRMTCIFILLWTFPLGVIWCRCSLRKMFSGKCRVSFFFF